MDYSKLSNEELTDIIKSAQERAAIYKTCKDGSHGAALDAYGFYKASKELKERENKS